MGHFLTSCMEAVLLAVALGTSGEPVPQSPSPKVLAPAGRMDTTVIHESSGLAKSAKYEGIFWTHGDSGNPAELFAVKADGELVARIPVVEAPNLDWEDIAVSDGFIYVGDIGNNLGWLRVRVVYKFAEPDPHAAVKALKPLASYRYKYPDEPFDAEALIVRGEQVYVIRKAGGKASIVYRLTPTADKHMALTEVRTLRSGWITGADLSADGRYLVTVSYRQLARYPVNQDLSPREGEPIRMVRLPLRGQLEACCFDGEDVILTTENGYVYRISAQDIEQQTRFVPPPPGAGE